MIFGFRLRFRLPDGEFIQAAQPSSTISLSRNPSLSLHPSVNLRQPKNKNRQINLCETDDLSIVGTPFSSPDDAQQAGYEQLQVIQLAHVLLGSGVDTGANGAIGKGPRIQIRISKGELQRQAIALGRDQHAFIDDQPGVTVFQGLDPQFSPLTVSVSSRLDTPLPQVIDAISTSESFIHRFSARIALASEL